MMTEPTLPNGFTARPATMADAQIVTDLLNAEIFSILGEEHFSYDECVQEWSEPGFELENSSRCVFATDGRLAGYVEIWDNDDIPTRIQAFGGTHPDFYGRGIGAHMLEWGEWRSQKALSRVPDGAQVRVLVTTPGHQPGIDLFRGSGYEHGRSMLSMRIDLDQEIPEPTWPEGLAIKTLPEFGEDGLRQFFQAYDEAFQDHWGYIAEADKEEKYGRFAHRTNDSDFDPTLYLALCEEATGEIAAVAMCMPKWNENLEVGGVDNFGVRPLWRKRGLALNMLYYIFGEFKQREKFKSVALMVDAQSLTGATRLYMRAGMHVANETQVWHKVIQDGAILEAE